MGRGTYSTTIQRSKTVLTDIIDLLQISWPNYDIPEGLKLDILQLSP